MYTRIEVLFMSEIIDNDQFTFNILNKMSDDLTDDQLIKLKNLLYSNLHDIQLQKQNYDLAVIDDNNDAKKLEWFAITEKVLKKSDYTIKQYVRSAWQLRTFIGKNFEDITSSDVKLLIAKKQLNNEWSDSTTISQCNYLRVFFSFLVDEEYISKNPMNKVKLAKAKKVPKYGFSAMELEAIRNVCYHNTREMAMVEFLYATGLRVASVVALKWRDLDLLQLKGTVKMKGGDTNEFQFSEKSAFYLIKMFDERMSFENRTKEEMLDRPVFASKRLDPKTHDYEGISSSRFEQLLKKIGKKANVKKVHPHRFRRTFACCAINRGMPLEELKEHMHHKSYNTTLMYASINNERLKQSYKTYCE